MTERPLTRRALLVSAAGLVLLTAGMTYVGTRHYYLDILTAIHPSYASTTAYAFVRPLIGVSIPANQFTSNFPDVRSGIISIVAAQPASVVTRYAVYLRDLTSGDWTGINENDPYDPASLLKVVVAIAAYRQEEDHPEYFSTPLSYTAAIAAINTHLTFAQPSALSVGHTYSVPFLIKQELLNSDNGAAFTLLNSLPDKELNGVYDDLSIPRPDDTNSAGYTLTALEYSRLLRALYNGALNLSWADSEQILEYLHEATFVSGIVAGVPKGVPVAHKYGEHIEGSTGAPSSIELSDCGIVYVPTNPYLLCVMVQGTDLSTLTGLIAQVSGFVYHELTQPS